MKPNLKFIRERAELLTQLRAFFDTRGFLEVQPPCLASDCVVDAYLDPITVDTGQLSLGNVDLPPRMFLQTSPESSMKRMLASGAPSIYSLGPVFRSGEHGAFHNIEFTMLEWYEVGGDLASGTQLLGELAIEVLSRESFDVRTYRQIFQDALQVDPIDVPLTQLRQLCRPEDQPLLTKIGSDRNAVLDVLMSSRIQPILGRDRPLIVTGYPLSQAALARPLDDDSDCCARFELFASGIELANGYDELTDAEVLLERAVESNAIRTQLGRQKLLAESTLYQSMRDERLPSCAGVALGVDRLLMLRVGANAIGDVIPFTIDRA